MGRKRLKERGVYSHSRDKLIKTDIFSTKILREFKKKNRTSRDRDHHLEIYISLSKLNYHVKILVQGHLSTSYYTLNLTLNKLQ